MKETSLMSQEEFEKYIASTLNLRMFDGVHRYKSILRAFKRGHCTAYGTLIPKRPFNNRKDTKGRYMNKVKKQVYNELTRRNIEATQG